MTVRQIILCESIECKATFGLPSLLRRVGQFPLIFDAGAFTRTSLSLRSHVLRQDQQEVLPPPSSNGQIHS
jgi:hypothetical protein